MGLITDIIFISLLIIGLVIFHELVHVAILYDYGCEDVGFIWSPVGPAITYSNDCFNDTSSMVEAEKMNNLFHVIYYSLLPIYSLLGLIFIVNTKNKKRENV